MNNPVGDRIKILRLKANLTQKELAKQFSISSSAIAMYEQGNREPNNKLIIKICKFFNCSADFLIGITDSNEDTKKYKKKQNAILQILQLVNELNIQQVNYLIKQLNKAKIKIDEEIINGTRMD